MSKSFVKNNILFFSRILFCGVLIGEKIKALKSPLKRVKEAQDKIREDVGANVDIFVPKNYFLKDEMRTKNRDIAFLYQDNNSSYKNYIDNLQRILDFGRTYDIEKLFLRMSDLKRLFPEVNLNDFESFELKRKFSFGDTHLNDELMYEEYLSLNLNDLQSLINMLDDSKIDTNFITYLAEFIKDYPTKKAIQEFLNNKSLARLENMLLKRLTLALNSDNTSKDRVYKKIFTSVEIKGERVLVQSTTSKGRIIDKRVISLLEHLEIKSYQELIDKILINKENQETFAIAALYLYIYQYKKIRINSIQENLSLYDRLYNKFMQNEKKISALYTKWDKISIDFCNMIGSLLLTAFIFCVSILGGISVDFLQNFLFHNSESTVYENVVETIFRPYRYSYELESELLDKAKGFIESIMPKSSDELFKERKSVSGDAPSLEDDEVIAYVHNLSYRTDEYVPTPHYFAVGYATSATYEKGQMLYDIQTSDVDYQAFRNVESVIAVNVEISPHQLKQMLDDDNIDLMQTLYPISPNYVITKIKIQDLNDFAKCFTIDCDRAKAQENNITDEEKQLLKSMTKPEIVYYYGIDVEVENTFVSEMSKSGSYTSLSHEEVLDSIVKGLDLDSDASIIEMFLAIQNKYYSKTPLKDAGLTNEIKRMNESEYFETIASLDFLICNLAATLTVQIDEDLVYVSGYTISNNYGQMVIKNPHAWAMKGDAIIDNTPITNMSISKDNQFVKIIDEIIDIGIQNKVPLYIILTLIALYTKRKFGPKVSVMVKVKCTSHMLNNPNVCEDYKRLKDAFYGEINITKEESSEALAERISQEFAGPSAKELRQLKKELQQEKDYRASMLAASIPFIREHTPELKRELTKKEKKSIK